MQTGRPDVPPQPAEIVQAAIEAMGGTIAIAQALVEGGRCVDLSGLDGEAAVLCAAVLGLPDQQSRALRPHLEALLRQVERLMQEIRRQ